MPHPVIGFSTLSKLVVAAMAAAASCAAVVDVEDVTADSGAGGAPPTAYIAFTTSRPAESLPPRWLSLAAPSSVCAHSQRPHMRRRAPAWVELLLPPAAAPE